MNVEECDEKIKQIECVVCGHPVMVDRWEQGTCHTCGWYHAPYYLTYPDRIIDPNMVSLNKARQLVRQGKPLKPTFDEFAEALENYGEMELRYQGRNYGILTFDDGFRFYEKNVKGSIQAYITIEDFKANAHINGVLLQSIWDEVDHAGYMST